MSEEKHKHFSYKITSDPHFMDEQNAMTPKLHQQFESLYFQVTKNKNLKKYIKKILELIEKHPDNPQLKNLLSGAYDNLGQPEKALEVNHWILKEHPDYLFGKINMAVEYYMKGEYEKMPEVLGEDMEIQALYPERDTFHVSEVTGFYRTAILYFLGMDDIESAKDRLEIIKQIAPDEPNTKMGQQFIETYIAEKNMNAMVEEHKNHSGVVHRGNTLPPQSEEEPVFTNIIIDELYNYNLHIDPTLLKEILALPRETLIADLETVLDDALRRYEYFKEDVELFGWDDDKMSFPLHAIMLLGELRAEESLPKILEIFHQNEEFLEFWFADHLYETLWEPLFHIANNHFDVIKKYMKEPGVDIYAKSVLSNMVMQTAFHHPERDLEVFEWFSELLDFYINSPVEDNITDDVLNAYIISDIIYLRYKDLLPKIKTFYLNDSVDEFVVGDFNTVEKDISEPRDLHRKKTLMHITDRYREIILTWPEYKETDEDVILNEYGDLPEEKDDHYAFENYHLENVSDNQPVHREKKIGRNDPCPCGSGKKYKKCCMNKDK